MKTLVLIGVSNEVTETLESLFVNLPSLNATFIVIPYMPDVSSRSLSHELAKDSLISIRRAESGSALEPGVAYIAPRGRHRTLKRNRIVVLSKGHKYQSRRPSVTVAMRSVEPNPGDRIVGVLMAGHGRDGAEGIKHIKNIGGITMVQSRESSSIWELPRAAIDTEKVDFVLSPHQFREKLISLSESKVADLHARCEMSSHDHE